MRLKSLSGCNCGKRSVKMVDKQRKLFPWLTQYTKETIPTSFNFVCFRFALLLFLFPFKRWNDLVVRNSKGSTHYSNCCQLLRNAVSPNANNRKINFPTGVSAETRIWFGPQNNKNSRSNNKLTFIQKNQLKKQLDIYVKSTTWPLRLWLEWR